MGVRRPHPRALVPDAAVATTAPTRSSNLAHHLPRLLIVVYEQHANIVEPHDIADACRLRFTTARLWSPSVDGNVTVKAAPGDAALTPAPRLHGASRGGADGETKAEARLAAGIAVLSLPELIKGVREGPRRDPDAAVSDGQHRTVASRRRCRDASADGRELDRIRQQIGDHPSASAEVAEYA